MDVLIIEDERLVAEGLKKELLSLEPGANVLAVIPGIAEALKWFASHPEPDLLFLDIQLNDGVSFEIFNNVKLQCPVIFTTAYDEYAIRAFKVNSIDYLLKPIDRQELAQALDKFHRLEQKSQAYPASLQALLDDLSHRDKKKFKERFMVHQGKMLMPVTKDKVASFFKDELIFMTTTDGQRHLTDFDTMDSLEELLDPKEFFRANRQYILHISNVETIRPHFTGKLTVQLKSPAKMEIDISREKAASFKAWLG